MDLNNLLNSFTCKVENGEREGNSLKVVSIKGSFATSAEDLWDAVTTKERLSRYFTPTSGDLKEGGNFALEGNANGKIIKCDAPKFFSVTWEFMNSVSWVDVTVSAGDSGLSELTLEHYLAVNSHWEEYGAGATGVGWMLGYVGLAYHLKGEDFHGEGAVHNPEEFFALPEVKEFMINGSKIWASAEIKAGETPSQAEAAADRTAKFYTGG